MSAAPIYHSVLFFVAAATLWALPEMSWTRSPLLCLALVLTVGMSHGALDYIKGRAVLRTLDIEKIRPFYVVYIAVALGTLLSWYFAPGLLIAGFLLLAAYHFGKEDAEFLEPTPSRLDPLFFMFKGSAVIAAPLYFSFAETNEIVLTLQIDMAPWVSQFGLGLCLIASGLSNVAIGLKSNQSGRGSLLVDFSSVLILNAALPPLLAFSLYFCFLHSVRHSMSLIAEYDETAISGVLLFVRRAWPLTLVVGVVCTAAFYTLLRDFSLDVSANRVIFLGLAALTFPHVILEHLFESRVVESTEIGAIE